MYQAELFDSTLVTVYKNWEERGITRSPNIKAEKRVQLFIDNKELQDIMNAKSQDVQSILTKYI